MPYKYRYIVKLEPMVNHKTFSTIDNVCKYCNDYYKLDIFSRDNMINYFIKRTKKTNKIFDGFEELRRVRV